MSANLLQMLSGMIPVLLSVTAAKGIYHLFQLESYQFPGYFRSMKRNPVQAWAPGLYAAAASLLLLTAFWRLNSALQSWPVKAVILLAFCLIAALAGRLIARTVMVKKPKKPFVCTSRVKRLYGFSIAVLSAFSLWSTGWNHVLLTALWPVLLPLLVAVCGFVAWGLEKIISECYFQSARRKLLAQKDLLRIGITGSYGKTSVKHILGTILSEKYPVLITPKSFNTPMGVTRTIRERLQPSHQVFVAEMGARHVGDIRELCRLVRPTLGILTSVGPQHLDTFKTVERVASTKYELIRALPNDGLCFFPDDGGICTRLYGQTEKPKTLVSLSSNTADVWSENISVSAEGSSFDLCMAGGVRIPCKTCLLGEHNILNILMAAAVAEQLGLTQAQIARGIQRIEPIPSPMELIKNPNSYTIINDGFNTNPVSAQASLAVLRQFPKRRIIITPGMVELGADEAKFNRAFGQAIAQAADIAIIIGKKRVQPILDGLREAGFPQENIHQVNSLDESTVVLRQLVRREDTVLYENDLPDNYQEN